MPISIKLKQSDDGRPYYFVQIYGVPGARGPLVVCNALPLKDAEALRQRVSDAFVDYAGPLGVPRAEGIDPLVRFNAEMDEDPPKPKPKPEPNDMLSCMMMVGYK
jgi:hypothetical protein